MGLTAPGKSSVQHFLGLDGLRGVAAFAVVYVHGAILIPVGYTPKAAALAVDFFFMLSGFVIAYAYDKRLGTGGMTSRQFVTVRLIRLYPMLFMGTLMGVVLFGLSQYQKHQFDALTCSLMMAGSFVLIPVGFGVGAIAYPLNAAAWSLFFEFFVNALFATRFGRLSPRGLAAFLVVFGIALIAMGTYGGPWIDIGFLTPTKFLLGFVRVSYSFWAGVLVFRVGHRFALPHIPISLIAALLLLLLVVPVDNSVDNPVYNLVMVLAVFPILVAFAASAEVTGMTARLCSWAGRLSYPLYLTHFPAFRAVRAVVEMTHAAIDPRILVAGGAMLSVVTAEIILLTFDEPVRRWLSKRSRARRVRSADPDLTEKLLTP